MHTYTPMRAHQIYWQSKTELPLSTDQRHTVHGAERTLGDIRKERKGSL